MKKYLFSLSLLICAFSFTGCYRAPTDDEYCLIPTTNNPSITYEKPASLMPGTKY